MNRQLKQDIDLLFDGSADETRAAAKRLGLEAGGAAHALLAYRETNLAEIWRRQPAERRERVRR